MERPPNPVTESIDGATGDITMSGDAMRWSPELADGQARAVGSPGALPGVDVAAGFGALLGLDALGVRRLVTGAVTSLATVAGDVVAELRQLTRGTEDDDTADDDTADDDEEQAPPDPPSSSPPSPPPPSPS
ncbi:hypothetical protein SAMN05660350_01620 [Geodermatophilus obscurus]|uniref:Uncharacterized protein n=1 Tax=Geodermatophilus obscurus TaxID=1861 RepID=A0A1M7TEB4_9ACTN|nr:hypothetical protein [Geodermatophilus obscurus]SHN68998.1 hypothetical protein SAMN05660350_01620 [Geodermatophilus obscurus]